ncbi:MAG: tetratricopeptide repeat protein [Proteobacteria bacterium]|nr:tetratricopeptide repeat protein [Pseudomonadota bacterium]
MVLLGRMLVMAVACVAFGRPAMGLAETVKDIAELAQEVLDAFEFEVQTNFEDETTIRAEAQRGNAKAQHELAVLLAVGKGAERHYAEAAQWFRRAAEQGHAGAQFWLGNLYMRGIGVTRDMDRMVQWWRKAALQGNISAQYALGTAYLDGRMVKQDIEGANAWFHMASGGTGEPKLRKNSKSLSKPSLSRADVEAAELEAQLAEVRARRQELFTKEGPQAGR